MQPHSKFKHLIPAEYDCYPDNKHNISYNLYGHTLKCRVYTVSTSKH